MVRLRENLARTGLAARIVVADALTWDPLTRDEGADPGVGGDPGFDAVLLDAPCSATGTIRRHPDLPHVRDHSGLRALADLQAALIDRALDLVRPGGRVVYCTCSLLPEEGERQVSAALARHSGLTCDSTTADLPGAEPSWAAKGGGLRLRPDFWADIGGIDGFFIACLRRPE
jgi:16S rRNA (cytosine967-C5)-methyltransferase